MLKFLNIFGKKKLFLSFEYGVTLATVAKTLDIELTRDIVQRAEDILIKEFSQKDPGRLATDMATTLLAVLEPSGEVTDHLQ